MSLERLFRPRGVAFVGATPEEQRYNGRILKYCAAGGYAGGVYPVNPKYREIFDLPCYASLDDVPGPVDVVVILVGPARVPDLLEQCRRLKIPFAIALGDLVAPADPNREEANAAIRRQIEAGAPRCVGPVCLGIVTPHDNLAMTIASGMLPGFPRKGGIGLISQSGGIMAAAMDRAHGFGGGFSAIVSSGGEFDLNVCDYMEYMLDDAHTRVISIYAEKLLEPQRFFRLADEARQREKPVLLLKTGRTGAGARHALTHSGAIASDAAIEDAACRRHGIIRVEHVDDLHMTAEVLCRARVQRGTGIAAVTQSGGFGTLLADRMSEAGVAIAEPAPETVQRILAETPVPYVGNPHDSGTGPPGNNAPHSRASLIAFQDDPAVGLTIYAETMYMWMAEGHLRQIEVAAHGRKPHLVCWEGGTATAPVIASLRSHGLIAFDSMRQTVAAVSALYRYADIAALPAAAPPPAVRPYALPARGGMLDDAALRALLEAYDIPLVPEIAATTVDDAAFAALRLGWPVVLKGRAEEVAHKSEHGLVALDLGTAQAVRAACAAMQAASTVPLQGFTVQPMLRGVEFVVGVKRDPALGPAVLLGLGGIFVESYGAPAIEMAPIDAATAEAMIDAVDRKGILGGYRSGRVLDRAGLVRTLVAAGRLAWDLQDRLEGLDLNPVIVGQGRTMAVDSLLSLRPAAPAMAEVAIGARA
jgi:acyl-CoA synthetase (NDP forming)